MSIEQIVSAIFIAGGILFGLMVGNHCGISNTQREAITNGAAHWESGENGQPVFAWGKAEEGEP